MWPRNGPSQPFERGGGRGNERKRRRKRKRRKRRKRRRCQGQLFHAGVTNNNVESDDKNNSTEYPSDNKQDSDKQDITLLIIKVPITDRIPQRTGRLPQITKQNIQKIKRP